MRATKRQKWEHEVSLRATDHCGNSENRVAAVSQQSKTIITKACPEGELKKIATEERGLPQINVEPESTHQSKSATKKLRERE